MKPNCEVLRKEEYAVRPIPHAQGAALIRQFHYARGCSNTSVFMHGLFREDDLVGAALWMPPIKACAVATARNYGAGKAGPENVLALSRLAVHPDVPQNGASFLIGRSIRLVRRDPRWKVLISFADESQNHEGRIYLATNWKDAGYTDKIQRWIASDGSQVSKKSTRTRTVAEMRARGCTATGAFKKKRFILTLF